MDIEAAAAAGAVAVAMAELLRQEEEEMTPYSDKDLAEGWEFKIVRAPMSGFRKPEQFRAVLAEEKKGGWILVEKFDDSRIRLKRPAGAKIVEGDFEDGYDPYRTVIVIGFSGEFRSPIILGRRAGRAVRLALKFSGEFCSPIILGAIGVLLLGLGLIGIMAAIIANT